MSPYRTRSARRRCIPLYARSQLEGLLQSSPGERDLDEDRTWRCEEIRELEDGAIGYASWASLDVDLHIGLLLGSPPSLCQSLVTYPGSATSKASKYWVTPLCCYELY